MSRRSSRSSNFDHGEFVFECKAAYLSIYDSIKEKIETQDSLLEGNINFYSGKDKSWK